MSDVAQLLEGTLLVRMLPLEGRPPEILTPRLLSQRLADLDPMPASRIAVDRWERQDGETAGTMTAEAWIRTFGVDLPPDTDPRTLEVPVRFLPYVLVERRGW